MPLANGQTFAGHRILRLLGSGGMGEVYLAQHPRLPRKKVALKILSADVSANRAYRARFIREADLASELDHPNIVIVHDRDEENGQLWISMNYVDGPDAARLLTEKFPGGMPTGQVVKIVTAVASALDYAHHRGLLHRDVKPANIMITSDEQRILLTDFGIARNLQQTSSLTATGFLVGTVAYAAPEQLLGQKLDGRTDQYALAATAYHLLTGSQLFPHSFAEKPLGHPALDSVMATALAKKPDDRFPSCTDFAVALDLAARVPWAVASAGDLSQGGTPPAGRTKSPTRPMPPEQSPASAGDDSVFIPSQVNDGGDSRRRRLLTAAIIASLCLVAAAFVIWTARQQDDRTTKAPSATPTTAAPSITFDGMRNFVESYYSDLPTHAEAAWAKLDSHCQNQTGLHEYLDFWATIQSVTVISISPRDSTSVIARLKYIKNNGQSDMEDRWLKIASVNGELLLDESGRIGAVA
jgi:serine/threonine protein kinase